MIWPPSHIGTLRTRWADGMTARAIADELRVTRNAVLGKAHRLGLEPRCAGRPGPKRGRDDKIAMPAPKASRRLGVRPKWIQPPEPTPPPVQAPKPTATRPVKCLPGSRMLRLFALKPGMCRYPIGDPRHASFRFCAADCSVCEPYCSHHHRIAHNAVGPVRAPSSSMSHPAGASKLLESEDA